MNKPQWHTFVGVFVVFSLAFLVFANTYHHAYHLDCGHAIVDNLAIRSLANIGQFFYDPHASSALASNIDYRPINLITYALNYAISGLDTWSWHLLQILLQGLFASYFFLFTRAWCQLPASGYSGNASAWWMLMPALIYVVHPTTSGVVNYLCARTSLLCGSFLIMGFYYYLSKPGAWRGYLVPLLYALALFTKVEAIAALAVFYFLDILKYQKISSPWRNLLEPLQQKSFYRRFSSFFLISLIYSVVRLLVLRDYNTASRSNLSALSYLFTQVTAWWFYLGKWFAPFKLIADDLTYPVFEHWWQPEVLFALWAWLAVFAVLIGIYRRFPGYFYLALAYIALLSPSSSILPLSEMVNEHRPYLPVAMASLIWLVPLGGLSQRLQISFNLRVLSALAVVSLLAILGTLTWERNKVYLTDLQYWEDVVKKAPSSRSHINFYLTLLAAGRREEAGEHLFQALKEAPYWHVVHTNVALWYKFKGEKNKAIEHYNLAVQYDVFTSDSHLWRGDFYLEEKNYQAALDDFLAAVPTQSNKIRAYRGIATAYAGLDNWQQTFAYTNLLHEIAPLEAEYSIVGISTPFFNADSSAPAGISYFNKLKAILPGREWIDINIKTLSNRIAKG